jgi:hypothetical protein
MAHRIVIKKVLNDKNQKFYQVYRYEGNVNKGLILETPSAQDALAFIAGFCSSADGLGCLVGVGEWN